MIPIPDLLHLEPHADVDHGYVAELLEMAFLGGDRALRIDQALGQAEVASSGWQPEFFERDLFLYEFVDSLTLEWEGEEMPVQKGFLRRVLANPPTDLATVAFRQAILRELESDAETAGRTASLHADLFQLLTLFKAPQSGHRLDFASFRLEILQKTKEIIETMVADFANTSSGLRRLHEVGLEIQASSEYAVLESLLDYENHLASVSLSVRLGSDGKVRHLAIDGIEENRRNPFYRTPLTRWRDAVRLRWRRYQLESKDIVHHLTLEVYLQIAPALRPLLQVMGHLQVYLTSRSFAAAARARGLEVSLARMEEGCPLVFDELFNPLLLRQPVAPVPCSLRTGSVHPVTIVTGPNSGGKTRLLQAIGLAQVLAQSGLYVPAAHAELPLANSLFASVVDRGDADQTEGRLGMELLRVRTLFQSVPENSLILLDELCSGTNPSEAIEIFSMVLQLLAELRPVTFITTHFLDYAHELAAHPPVAGLEFLQVEVDERQNSTYQFTPGVAETSLAAGTARRVGVTFEELSALIERRLGRGRGGSVVPLKAPRSS